MYIHTVPSALLRTGIYARRARMYIRGCVCMCVLGDLATGLPPGAHINQKLRFRPSPKHGQARNLDAPGVPEVISLRRE